MKKFDVVVIGGGVAGAVAALTARQQGASVAIIAPSLGASSLSSGSVDIADGDNFFEAMNNLAQDHSHHPYALCGDTDHENLLNALAVFRELLAPTLSFAGRTDHRNMLLATQAGTIKKCAWVQSSQALDLLGLQTGTKIGVVGLESFLPFDAAEIARMLNWMIRENTQLDASFVPIKVPFFFRTQRYCSSPVQAAQLFDATDIAVQFASELKQSLTNSGLDLKYLLLPPIMGLAQTPSVIKKIADMCGVFGRELLATPQSVPGLRLAAAISTGLANAGIEKIDATVDDFRRSPENIISCRMSGAQETTEILTRSVILASGRFFGGGISAKNVIAEAIFSLPVWTNNRPIEEAAPSSLTGDLGEGQPLFSAGLKSDRLFRPLDRTGRVFANNLFAAGSILGGYDPASDGTGLGVCILTGYLAGKNAAIIDH